MLFICWDLCSRISSNNFTGRMPDFFRSWKDLERLYVFLFLHFYLNLFNVKLSGVILIHLNCVVNRDIQASGFEGPIPSSISILRNLTEL
jgi:hypothetical protein